MAEEELYGTKNFDRLLEEYRVLAPVKVRFKDEAWEMQLLNLFIFWFNPNFLTQYTTVIGNSIFFPDREYIFYNESGAMKTLAHEMVHILDSQKIGMGGFGLGYLFPQILALGVLSFPLFGLWSLAFLLFLLPLPAPFRAESEARAYALDMLITSTFYKDDLLDKVCALFTGPDYYYMNRDSQAIRRRIQYWMEAAESGKESASELTKVLLIYEMVLEG